METNKSMYYPVFLNLKGRSCVVIGGGKVAERKARSLLKAGANIKIISPEFTEGLKKLSKRNSPLNSPSYLKRGKGGVGGVSNSCGRLQLIKRPFRIEDLKDAFLVIAATSSRELHKKIASYLMNSPLNSPSYLKRGKGGVGGLLNVVDEPELCTFIVPSVVKRGPLTIAISTSGASPAMAKAIRKEIEKLYGKTFGEYLKLLERLRKKLINLPSQKKKKIFSALSSRSVFKRLRDIKTKKEVKDLLDELLQKERISV
jgi:precorrin-2 dehydrogenase/sirohydrochlorin ferrochelatase